MEERTGNNNAVTISGEIVSDFEFSHEIYGEKFYTSQISAKRMSGVADAIPIMVSDRLIDITADWKGDYVRVEGQFRSYNNHTENGNRLILSVFAQIFERAEELPFSVDRNYISLDGYVCKQPVYRETPNGREIADLIIAVNRAYGKSDYIPCITWGRNAKFTGSLNIGEHIAIEGRIQSREYNKYYEDGSCETRIAYEVSASNITLIEESEEQNADE